MQSHAGISILWRGWMPSILLVLTLGCSQKLMPTPAALERVDLIPSARSVRKTERPRFPFSMSPIGNTVAIQATMTITPAPEAKTFVSDKPPFNSNCPTSLGKISVGNRNWKKEVRILKLQWPICRSMGFFGHGSSPPI